MSELQTDSVESEVIEPAVIETPDNGAELATASESEHSENTEIVDEAAVEAGKQQTYINKQYGTIKQGERDLATANQELEQFKQADRDRQAAAVGTIPPMPDAFEDDFDEKVKQRDEAIIAQANFNANQNAYVQQQELSQQQAAQAQQVKIQESMTSYSSKATELGIDQKELQDAGNAVAGYGLSDDLVLHILGDSDGPLITKHLAANPQDGYKLASMSPFDVGSFLGDIKTKASALKPKTSKAPAPVDNLQGVTSDFEGKQYKYISGSEIDLGAKW